MLSQTEIVGFGLAREFRLRLNQEGHNPPVVSAEKKVTFYEARTKLKVTFAPGSRGNWKPLKRFLGSGSAPTHD